MQHTVEFKGVEPHASIDKLIAQSISKLERIASTLSPELASLRLFVEHIAAHKLHRVSITLELHGKTLVAKSEQHDLRAGVREAFEDIEQQMHKYKANLRGEHWKARRRRFLFPRSA